MIDKSKMICLTPFGYTEVFDDAQWLCCPSWLKENIYETSNIKQNFNSEKAQNIRKSILDGSYKYCDETQCPHLASLKQDILIDGRFIPKTKDALEKYKPISDINMVNFCFDRSCNLQCPTCRNELINYLGKDRENVEDKLQQVNNEISQTIKRLYLSGTSDPFYSKSFRQFLVNFDPEKYPKLEKIHLHTNGILWTEQLWSKMHKIHPFVKSCEVSIDAGTKNTYENKVRIGGSWDTLMKNLDFIVKLPKLRDYIFSFVVQKHNYKEMLDFYEIITSLKWNGRKNITVFFNHVLNWGTFTEEEYSDLDIANPEHLLHEDFLKELLKIHNKRFVSHNFNHLVKPKISLI